MVQPENSPEHITKKSFKLMILCVFLTTPWICSGATSDLEKEKRWSEQIADGLLAASSRHLAGAEPGDDRTIVADPIAVSPVRKSPLFPFRGIFRELRTRYRG